MNIINFFSKILTSYKFISDNKTVGIAIKNDFDLNVKYNLK